MVDLLGERENWSWSKFFSGFIDGRNSAKAIVTTFHQAIIVALVGLSILGGLYLKDKFFPKKVEDQRILKVESQGGAVDASQKTKKCEVNLIKFGGTNQ